MNEDTATAVQKPVLLRIRGSYNPFLAEQVRREDGRVHAFGQWRHREGAHNATVRLYGERGWRSWPSNDVQIRPLPPEPPKPLEAA